MSLIQTIQICSDEVAKRMTDSINGPWELRMLEVAHLVATWSKDPSTKVGAVIVDQKRRVVGMGYNGFARKVSDADTLYANRDVKLLRVIHAELNAIFNANKSVEGCTIYTTFFPCPQCAAALVQNGIKSLVTVNNKSDSRYLELFRHSQEMLLQGDVNIKVYDLNTGWWQPRIIPCTLEELRRPSI